MPPLPPREPLHRHPRHPRARAAHGAASPAWRAEQHRRRAAQAGQAPGARVNSAKGGDGGAGLFGSLSRVLCRVQSATRWISTDSITPSCHNRHFNAARTPPQCQRRCGIEVYTPVSLPFPPFAANCFTSASSLKTFDQIGEWVGKKNKCCGMAKTERECASALSLLQPLQFTKACVPLRTIMPFPSWDYLYWQPVTDRRYAPRPDHFSHGFANSTRVLPSSVSADMQVPVSSVTPCEYDPLCGGYPLAILSTPLPPDFSCVVCQRIARDALTACKGLRKCTTIATPQHTRFPVFGSGPPVLRRLCVRAAQAVPALLRRGLSGRTGRQPCRTVCRRGCGGAMPCVLWVGGDAGRARRALGAVPTRACPVPGRRGTLPRRPDTRAGSRSATRPRWLALSHSRFTFGAGPCVVHVQRTRRRSARSPC